MTSDLETATMDDMIARLGIAAESHNVPGNPHMPDSDRMYHYHVTLTRATGQTLQTYFSVGRGIIEQTAAFKKRAVNEKRFSGGRLPLGYDYWRSRDETAAKYKPDAARVLGCLAMDASGYDNARDFTDWCNEYGYSDDSIKARKIYDVIAEQAKALRHFLADDYDAVVYETKPA